MAAVSSTVKPPVAFGRHRLNADNVADQRAQVVHLVAGHFRRYDPAALTGLLRAAGLENVLVQQFGGPLGYALEAARNRIGRRRARSGAPTLMEASFSRSLLP
jgi:hypothetical protein